MLRFVFAVLAFLSGSVALAHELLWTRRLIDLLGATESVTGRVLGLFFLGLALGGWLATRWGYSDGNPAFRLAIAEFSIAIFSLPAMFLPLWADELILALGTDGLTTWQGGLLKLVLSAGVVLPPSIAMGTTMPLFIRVMTSLGATVRGAGVWLYSLNMLGAVLGLWFVSTFLLDLAGVRGAMVTAALGNVIIAATAFGLSRMMIDNPATESGSKNQKLQSASKALDGWTTRGSIGVFLLAFASGLMVLASEMLILRLLALVAPSSLQSTSALLASVILFLALGSMMVAVMNRFGLSSENQLLIGATGAALFCALCPLILYQTTNQLVSIRYLLALDGRTLNSLNQYWFTLFAIVALSSGATMFFSGFVFPSILSLHSKSDPQGRSVGLLLAVNGVGGLVGAEVANWLMIFQFGIYLGFAILAISIALATIGACWITDRKTLALGLTIGTLAVGIFTGQPYEDLRYLSPHAKKNYKIKDTRFGRDGVLLIVDDQAQSRSMLMNNQYILGSSGYAAAERRQLLLPWLLHPQSEEVCCLGFATGMSAGGLEVLDSPPNVTSIELSEMVVDAAGEFFRDKNQSFYDRAGNQVILEDGRTFMACAENGYDLIVADLFRPHGAGEGRLFSVEHFSNVKRALRPEGLFCQWLPAHQLNQKQFEIIAATFLKVFPNTLVINGGLDSRTPTIGLCGWQNDKPWETSELVEKIKAIRNQKGISDKLALNAQLLIVGVLKEKLFDGSQINTLDNALLEIDAGKFWILKDLRPQRPSDTLENGFLSGKNWKTFTQQLFEKTAPVLDAAHRKQFIENLK
jgi:spermidine synthase